MKTTTQTTWALFDGNQYLTGGESKNAAAARRDALHCSGAQPVQMPEGISEHSMAGAKVAAALRGQFTFTVSKGGRELSRGRVRDLG